jgi:hypothetical protein
MMALIASNPRHVTQSCPQALFQAAAYPEAIASATAQASRKSNPSGQDQLRQAAPVRQQTTPTATRA